MSCNSQIREKKNQNYMKLDDYSASLVLCLNFFSQTNWLHMNYIWTDNEKEIVWTVLITDAVMLFMTNDGPNNKRALYGYCLKERAFMMSGMRFFHYLFIYLFQKRGPIDALNIESITNLCFTSSKFFSMTYPRDFFGAKFFIKLTWRLFVHLKQRPKGRKYEDCLFPPQIMVQVALPCFIEIIECDPPFCS